MTFLAVLSILAFGFSILYHHRDGPSVKKMVYESTLFYNELVQEEWWHEIKPYGILLGGIPLEDKGHALAISQRRVNAVLSLVEPFEQEPGLRHTPVSPERWRELGIDWERVEARDFHPLTEENLEKGVAFLEKHLQEHGHRVYIHCKAGRGRSASIVLAYLMKTFEFSFEEAFHKIYSQRPYIKISDYQKESIIAYIHSLD